MSLYNPNTDKVVWFESIEAYADWLDKSPCKNNWEVGYGNIKLLINNLRTGTLDYISQAEKIIDKMNDQQLFSVGQVMLLPSVVGFMPNVPAAICGHPESMFARQRTNLDGLNTPISIYIEPGISGGLTDTQVINRGIAVLAFVLAMNILRPIEVYMTETNGATVGGSGLYGFNCVGAAVKIDTKPLDLARACWCFTNQAYVAPLGFIASTTIYKEWKGDTVNHSAWSWCGRPQQAEYQQGLRDLYNMQSQDVFIPGGHLSDTLMLNNPVLWVQQMIEKHTKEQQDV